jgi:cobalt-zinc-cadmium efflux system outer membrane protein
MSNCRSGDIEMRHTQSAVFAILLALIAAPAQSQHSHRIPTESVPSASSPPRSFRLADLEQIALARNPTLVQADAQVRISRGKALQAGLYPNPHMGYVADQIGVEGTAGEFQGGFIEQEIVTAGKLGLSRSKYLQESRQAEIQVVAQRYRILQGVRAAYYETLARQQRLELRRKLAANAEEVNRTLVELENVGQANRGDVLQGRIQLQRAQANLKTAERRLQASWEQLAAFTGEPDMTMAPLDGSLEFATNEFLNRDEAYASMLACSPQLQFAQAEVARDRIALQRERVESISNITVRGEVGRNFESRDTVAGIEIGIKLPIYDRNQGAIVQAQGELTRAEAEVARVELMLRQKFAKAFGDYEAALATTETYRKQALPQSEELYKLQLESFKQRRAAWPQVLDAQREHLELVEEYIDNLLEARRASTRISSLLLEGGLEQPPEPTPQGHRDATPKPR